jgi:hypothetical protein
MREGFRLEGNETSWIVDEDKKSGHQVTMYSKTPGHQQEILPLAQARRAVLQGIGYATEPEAQEAGRLWRSYFMAAFASLRIGVDFGDRAVRSTRWSRHAIAAVSGQSGRSAINYQGGILVYESQSPPISCRQCQLLVRSAVRHVYLLRSPLRDAQGASAMNGR